MICPCSQFFPLELNRNSIDKRIKASKTILKSLVPIAENDLTLLKLLQCPHCRQFWQTGREWNFDNAEYVFQVPEISVGDWLDEAYIQPAACLIYGALMGNYLARQSFEPSDKLCKSDGCQHPAIKLSGVCKVHHIEQLQRFGMLPVRPAGRLFTPYE